MEVASGQGVAVDRTYLEMRIKYSRQFEDIFRVKLAKWFDNLTGFDLIGFDDFVKPADGESTEQTVLRDFGQEGVDLIKKLISPSVHRASDA